MSNNEEGGTIGKKISIIVPCYNCESTLDYCLDAIFAQTIGLENLEIILVNDDSTDNTLAMLYEYEKLYPNTIIVINCTENGRQGTARNIGLLYATGEYVAYVDDDDVMERNMYELLYQAAKETNAEVVVSDNQRVSEVPNLDIYRNGTIIINDIWEIKTNVQRGKLLIDSSINNAVWNKLYQREFLIKYDIHFAEHIIYEDILFTMLMKAHVSKLCILNNAFYYHVVTEASSSVNGSFDERRIFDYLGVHAEVIEEMQKRGYYTFYRNDLLNWYVTAYLICGVWHVEFNRKLNPEYLTIMDESVEKLFPKMVSRRELHNLLLEELKREVVEAK